MMKRRKVTSGNHFSLKLLQALNDQNPSEINECVKHKNYKKFINTNIAVKRINNPRIEFDHRLEFYRCLTYALSYNNVGIVRQLVEAGADVTITDSNNNTTLHIACECKTDAREKVEYLLKRNARLVTARNKLMETALHHAARAGNDDVISVLIQHGAQVNARAQFSRTALHVACREGHSSCIHALVTGGADVEAKERGSAATPLYSAAQLNQLDCVKILIEQCKASINSTVKNGNTPLHCAAHKGFLDVVKQLTSYQGCDIKITNNAGETASDVAKKGGHADVADYLASLSIGSGAAIDGVDGVTPQPNDSSSSVTSQSANIDVNLASQSGTTVNNKSTSPDTSVNAVLSPPDNDSNVNMTSQSAAKENTSVVIPSQSTLSLTSALPHTNHVGKQGQISSSGFVIHVVPVTSMDVMNATAAGAQHAPVFKLSQQVTPMDTTEAIASMSAASNVTDDRKLYKLLTEKKLLKIAKQVAGDQLDLGIHLDISHAEIKQINRSNPQHFVEATFTILLTWRERSGNKTEKEQVDELEEALREIKRLDLLHYIGR